MGRDVLLVEGRHGTGVGGTGQGGMGEGEVGRDRGWGCEGGGGGRLRERELVELRGRTPKSVVVSELGSRYGVPDLHVGSCKP